MASSNSEDPYIDPNTGILRNLTGATTQSELDDRERRFATIRSYGLDEITIKPTRDLVELEAIHRHLFQDIYPWAGEIRTLDIWKGGEPFGPVSMIRTMAHNTAATVATPAELAKLPRSEFVERIASYYNDFNYIHPFREGNGRTQRIFLARLTNDAGWDLDWNRVTEADNIAACHHDRQTGKADHLITLLDDVVIDLPPRSKQAVSAKALAAQHPTIGDKLLPIRSFGWAEPGPTNDQSLEAGRGIDD